MFEKKFAISFIIFLGIFAVIIGAIYKNENNKVKTFYASVNEVKDGYILVSPLPNEDIANSSKEIIIYTEDKYNEGDNILIYYKGKISETNPSTIDVSTIEIIGTNLENDDVFDEDTSLDEEKVETNSTLEDNSPTSTNNDGIEYSEGDIIDYFDSELKSLSTYEKTNTYKEKAKKLFITVVDFLFYDSEIKGHKFKELSNSAKLKVLNIAFEIDNKIEEMFPEYKETLADKYQDAKNMIVAKYLEITTEVCTNHESYCDTAKKVWSTIKEKASLSWDIIKKYASQGITNLKEWYEVYSGK